MHYTIGQLRDITGLSVETFRHWKRVLPDFAARSGRTPFTTGDLLAASLFRELTEIAGIRIGALVDLAPQVVDICNSVSWGVLQGSVTIIDLVERRCRLVRDPSPWKGGGLAILVPLDPLLDQLRGMLLRDQEPVVQGQLNFPPHSLAARQG